MEFANDALAAGFLDMIAYPGPWMRYIVSPYVLKNISNVFSAKKHILLNVLIVFINVSPSFMANILMKIFVKQMNKCRL